MVVQYIHLADCIGTIIYLIIVYLKTIQQKVVMVVQCIFPLPIWECRLLILILPITLQQILVHYITLEEITIIIKTFVS